MKRGSGRIALGIALLAFGLLVSACSSGKAPGVDGAQQVAAPGGERSPAGGAGSGSAGEVGKPISGTYQILTAESKAGYEVKEVFLVDSLNVTAVGTTSAIEGELILADGALQPSTVVVDVTTLKSDRSMRDNQLKSRGLETNTYGTASFTISGVEGSLAKLEQGREEVAFQLKGTAKIHGVEKELIWEATAKAEGELLRLKATVLFEMALFNMEPPNIAGRIRVDEQVRLNVELVAKQK